ncbi:MAG TPA: hypothetical protein VG871_21215 [Vicinamibacterales bacterium]|nr:hypothetical protein [Vicinamibacterales bacterium]
MKRYVSVLVVLVLAGAAVVSAQSPAGWKLRVDRSTSSTDPDDAGSIKFTQEGGGFHAVNPQAAVYWNPANTATGNYSIKATFTLLEPSNHTNYYGIVFGGRDLDGANQEYVYFMVAQDGTWLLKTRKGSGTQEVAGRMKNAAVKTPDATGKSVNNLEVRVSGDMVQYFVNGTMVDSTPKSALGMSTDGIYGLRVNHFLNVRIDGLTKQ